MKVQEIKGNKTTKRISGKLVDRMRVAAYCRVSKDDEEQLNSYDSQIKHYTNLINEKDEWQYVGIYADAAITGTQVNRRVDFQRMINDALNGEIDMIITKSISRFARNTLDTLKYVRMLKEKGIAVFFEDENINTTSMDGELLLTILSSVAQQEVANISDNVKKGLKMKMKRGEMVGFQGCLGYDYDKVNKTLSVNMEEAKIIKYIFERYIQGIGCTLIEKELNEKGYKTKLGNEWAHGGALRIIKNEKYCGDLLLGKTYTLDPITKRRLMNYGEEDKYYIKDHHEAIIDRETFEKAQEILNKRSFKRLPKGSKASREKYSRRYAFSSMIECEFCKDTFSRRSWHTGNQYKKIIWQCTTNSKKGKTHCPHSKAIPEYVIEAAFIESYKLLVGRDKKLVESFIERVETSTSVPEFEKMITTQEKTLSGISTKKMALLDLMLEGEIDKELMELKMLKLSQKEDIEKENLKRLKFELSNSQALVQKVREIKSILSNDVDLKEFNRKTFETLVEKIIVGRIDKDGNIDPYHLTFIYRTGFDHKIDAEKFRIDKRRKKKKVLQSCSGDEINVLSTQSGNDTR
ncbi:recombinase family protein [Acidaminobacter sp. JC074]|uniref:recombinase family protein n=1 Tax=Acidaminobacter sp. JC074 TaxID=2530199 RepID=UPI001F0DA058|nr:recombinase family protein [Acidaminobacter sp. JC074]MCH4888911.1 recombinase family protein [Acidaminobacter sp. JC074]